MFHCLYFKALICKCGGGRHKAVIFIMFLGKLCGLIHVLSSELLACKIRQCTKIRGINLPSNEYERNEIRITTFADDTTIFVKSQNCIKEVINIFDDFSRVSGLSVNHAKSDAVWIGSLKNNNFSVGNVNWKLSPNNTVKILGVTFSPSIPVEQITCNWEDKMIRIECSIRAWTMRGLSMIGRNLIVKTLLASQLSYLAPVLNFPEKIMNKLNTIFFKFVWNRAEAVKRCTIIADYEQGGINMFNVKIFFDSLKLSWIKKLVNAEVACWKNIPLYYINKFGMGLMLFNSNCTFKQIICNTNCKLIINSFPEFYYKLIKSWFDIKHVSNDDDISSNLDQVIWNNSVINIKNKTLFHKEWIESGIIYIRDLYDDNGVFHPLEHFMSIIKRKGAVLLQYCALRKALPRKWRDAKIDLCFEHNTDDNIVFNSISLKYCSSKLFRHELVKQVFVPPNCENYWVRRFPRYIFHWDKIWLSIPSCTDEAKLITLNWKIIHNIYPTKVLLHKMGKENSNICNSCNVVDYLEHFFCDCIKTKPIWVYATNVIRNKLNIRNFTLSVENIMFNINSDIHDNNSRFINYVIVIGKMCISKFRYGDHPCLLFLFERELRLRGLLK